MRAAHGNLVKSSARAHRMKPFRIRPGAKPRTVSSGEVKGADRNLCDHRSKSGIASFSSERFSLAMLGLGVVLLSLSCLLGL